ncbi:hypothetical protein DFH28DRAFT_979446 [Melampsora americana]|nr:hypothetical protein DFH28DRAFT_979446 [Melampsora americana]
MGGEKQRLPGIIVRTVEEIYQRGVNTPNLFCTPEDLNRVQDLVKNFATPPNYGLHYDLAHENIHTICASLIWFLRALPAPLLDEARFDLLSLCCSNLNSNLEVVPPLEKAPDTGMIGIAQRILRHIPAERFNLFIYLFSFMSQTERSPEYDLTSRILGDCFGPALFLPRQSSNGDDALNNINTSGTSSLEASNLVVWMLTHWDLIVNELLPEKFEIKKFRPSPAIPTIKDSWATWQGFRVNQDQEGPSLILPIKQIRRKSSAFEYHFGTSKNFPPLPPHYTRVDDDATPEPLNGVESKPFSHKSFETSTETASHPSGPQHKFRRRSSAFDYHSINRTAVKKSPLGAGGKRTNGKSSPLKDTKEIEEAEAPHDPSQIPHAFPRQLRTADHDLTDLSSIPTPTATAVSDLSDLLVSVDEVGRDEKYEKALKSFKFGDLPPESPTNTSSRRQRQSPHPIVLTKSTSNGIKSAVHKSQDVSFEHNRNFSFGSNNFLEGDRVFVQESLSVPGTASNAFQASISPLKTKAPVSPKLTAQLAHHDTSSVPFHKTQSPITPATIQNHHAPRISRRRSSCHESTSLDRPIHRRINHSVSVSKYYDGRAHTSKPIVKTIREIVAERKKGLVSHTHDFEVHTVGAGSTYKQNSDEKSVRDSQLMPSPVVYATWELVPVDLNLARTPVQNSTNVKLTQEGLP